MGRCRHGFLSASSFRRVAPLFDDETGFGYNICAARRNNAAP